MSNFISLNLAAECFADRNKKSIRHYSPSGSINLLHKLIEENNLNPVYCYEDLHLDATRKNISDQLTGLSGVYLIFNNITGDYYVGSASTGRFNIRFSNHLVHLTGSKVLKNAVRKYGIREFSFLVLELFPDEVTKENNKKLLDMEDLYLKSLLPNYNILTEAGSSFGYKHTELSRISMKNNYSLKRRDLIGNLNKNKVLSESTKERIRAKLLDRGKLTYSEEALNNMKKNSKPVILYNLDKTVFGGYVSISEAAKSINCDEKTIKRALQTEKKIVKRRFIVHYK